ncbi:MAG: multicopper oxidase domain-containing protein [Gammaproteobacteria bacterium]|nr:multicopper oxidase domain-containing protein [Gammaproteobacteria bacterium]
MKKHIVAVCVFMFALPAVASHNMGGGSSSAGMSTNSINIDSTQTGSFTISGNDGGSQRQFRWSLPSGLTVTTGASSNLNRFEVLSSNGYVSVESRGSGSFSATINVSSASAGSFVMNNLRADIPLSSADVSVNVADTSGGASMGGGMDGGGGAAIPVLDASNVTLVVRQINRTMSDGANIPFWVFCEGGMGGGGGCTLPSPVLELDVNQTANVVLNMMMAPQEPAPYNGHTIHPHGLDVPTSEDGVPETGAGVNGDTYSFSVDSRYVGSHMYHCHVHTVKHLEMGMYGAFIVKDGNRINSNGPTYDFEWNMVFSTVDPAYHTATGDSTVFADYNPRYFLVNGQEGLSQGAPAEILTAAPGANVVIRLVGLHSVNSLFEVRDAGGSRRNVTLYNIDGFPLANPRSVSSVEVSPGQTKDVMITLPSGSGSWYPQVSYRDLRNNSTYNNGRVYTRIDY